MRDYYLTTEDGRCIAVADLPLIDIIEGLAEGFKVDGDAPEEAIRERLEIELIIRREGLRDDA